jgi:hypothetical protein
MEKQQNQSFLSRSSLAKRWDCSRATLKRRERDGILPVYKLGRAVRYKLVDIELLEKSASVNRGGIGL